MQVQYIKEYSNCLDREMEYKIYGQGGKLCLAIPSQNGRFFEWEDRGMNISIQTRFLVYKRKWITMINGW